MRRGRMWAIHVAIMSGPWILPANPQRSASLCMHLGKGTECQGMGKKKESRKYWQDGRIKEWQCK